MNAAPVKAARGERKRQALEAIKGFEKNQQLWGAKELGEAIGCSPTQAFQLIQSLFTDGLLVRANRTVVVPEAFVTAA